MTAENQTIGEPNVVHVKEPSYLGNPSVHQAHPSVQRRSVVGFHVNVSWTLAGNLILAVCQWGQLVVLTKTVAPVQVGQFALAFAITAPIVLAANLGLRTVQVTDVHRQFSFAEYFVLRFWLIGLAMMVIVGVGGVAEFSRDMIFLLIIIGGAKGIDALSDIIYGAFQQAEWMAPIGKAQMLNGVVSLGALAVAVVWTENILWGAIGSATGSLLTFVVYNIPLYRRWARENDRTGHVWRWASLPRLAILAAPLGFAYLLTSLNPNIPNYVIARTLGEHDLGIFAALVYLTMAGQLIVSACAQVALPRLAVLRARGDMVNFQRLIQKLIGGAIGLGAVALLVVWLVGEPVVRIVYQAEYAETGSLLLWLVGAMSIAFVVWFLDVGLAAARLFAVQVPINFAMVVICSAASLWLIPRYGLVGAAWALCFSFAFQAVWKAVVLHRAMRGQTV